MKLLLPIVACIRARGSTPVLLVLLALAASVAKGADAAKKDFDIAGGEALVALKRFISQSGEQLLYAVDAVEGLKTKPVKGQFTAREALDRMIAGTELRVVQDRTNGGFSLVKVNQRNEEGAPRKAPAEGAKNSTTNTEPSKRMKRTNPITLLSAWIALALAPNHTLSAAAGPGPDRVAGSGAITGRVKNSVTGNYLNRARITVKGTDQVVYTDEFGGYRLVNLPSGPVVLEVFYTDLDPREISLSLSPGQNLEQDIELTSRARYGAGDNDSVLRLDRFVVASNKETDAEAIATNEQRFAPNIKNVIATNALGDIFGSNAGDFLKFLPGLAAEYDNAEIRTISIRGIGGDMTGVSVDGAPLVTGNNSGLTRMVEIRTQALNNVARVEVTKVPTPATPADTLAGSVNMISKNAFERSRAEFSYGINLAANGNALDLKRTPDAFYEDRTWKIKPGFDFDYTLPIGRNFGIVVTGMQSNKFNSQNITTKTWNIAGTSTGASASQPYFQQYLLQSAPRSTTRTVFSAKADWKVAPFSVLSIGGRWSRNVGARTAGFRLTPTVGTVGTPTPTTGTAFSYGPDFTIGATGRGGVSLAGDTQYSQVDSEGANLSYRFDNGKWRVLAGLNYSGSESYLGPKDFGLFAAVNAALSTPVRVTFSDVGPDGPARIQAFDNNNREVDLHDIGNYRVSTATEDVRKARIDSRLANLDIRRALDLFPVPTALQVGGLRRIQTMDRRTENRTWNYAGPNVAPSAFLSGAVGMMEAPRSGFGSYPMLSGRRTWDAFVANPSLFTQTAAQIVTAENARLAASQYGQETVSALYVQTELRLLKNRLNVLTGVRFEQTEIEGQGLLFDPSAVFVRNADGSFARNAQGARIRKPEAGAANSLQETRLVRKERAYEAERKYHGYYPSLHLTYEIQDNFLARFAYARTYGRPDFVELIPNTTINEADLGPDFDNPSVSPGSISVRNTGLRPWTANNYDLSLEYYTRSGGLFSAGVFRKDIKDFFGDSITVATPQDIEALGLDPRYVGWDLMTKFNSGSARVSGVEFNARHSLRALGGWGRYFTAFANATQLRLEGNPHASFKSFIPRTANWGFSFNWSRLTVTPKWNYRGLNKLVAVPASGPDAFRYIKERVILDLNVAYRLTQRLSITASASNVFNNHLTQMIYGAQTPGYARRSLDGEYGAAIALGLRGSF